MTKFILHLNGVGPIIWSCIHKSNIFTHLRLLSGVEANASYGNNEKSQRSIPFQRETITALQQLLRINKIIATHITQDYNQLCKVPPENLIENYKICKYYGFTNKSIISYPYILGEKELSEKINILNELPDDINDMVALLKLTKEELQELVINFKENKNRVTYFAHLFNVTPLQMCEHIIQKPFLRKTNLERVTKAVHLLKKYGITDREIVNDMWALNYNIETMERRIKFAKENNLEKVKTWMIRVQPHIFQNYIRIRSDNKLILGNNSVSEYLSTRLECPIEHANYIITKAPALKTKSVKKMDEIIDYLYEQGFKPIQICSTPKILLHSVKTMKKRVSELQQHGVIVDNLNLLTKTQKQYALYYSMLLKSKTKDKVES